MSLCGSLAPDSCGSGFFFGGVMKRIVFFIDGFNLYHALKERRAYHKYKWLDLSKLSQCYVTRKEKIEDIYYFSALATWSAQKVAKHQTYIRALKFRGVQVVYGKFKHRDKLCLLCNRSYTKPEEKQTDVNIAIYLNWQFKTNMITL